MGPASRAPWVEASPWSAGTEPWPFEPDAQSADVDPLGAGAGVPPASTVRPFQWLHDPYEAAALANGEQRGLLVDFFAFWCPPCRLLEATTFRDPLVWAEIGMAFVPLRIDVTEETARTKALLEALGVDALPTILVLDPSGHEVARLSSYLPAEPFVAWLRHAAGTVKGAATPTAGSD